MAGRARRDDGDGRAIRHPHRRAIPDLHACPDGVEHWLEGVYREVVPPERLVFTHAWLDAQKRPTIETLVTITFADRGGKTELTLRQTGLVSPASRAGHEEGWGSTFNRLQDYLETMQ